MARQSEIALLIKRGRLDRAEQLCQAEILTHPTDPQTWYYLGAVQSLQGRRSEAIRSLKLAASYVDDPVLGKMSSSDGKQQDDNVLLRAAQALLRVRAYADALTLYQRLDFALPPVILGLGRCYWGLGDYTQALTLFSGLWEARPDWLELGLAYARALCSVDRQDQAGQILHHLYLKNPHEAELIHQYTLWLLSNKGKREAAAWVVRQSAGKPSEKLLLLQRALAESTAAHASDNKEQTGKLTTESDVEHSLTQQGESTAAWLNTRQQSQWESFKTIQQLPGDIRWFGDNTALLKYALSQAPKQGPIVECGVFHGRSISLLAQWSRRECHGFDSFQGLPEAWSAQESAGAYSTQGRIPLVPENAALHQGWFEDTIPAFTNGLQQPVALLHVDCDLYSSTVTVLKHLLPYLAVGSVVVFDDMVGYPEWREHEYRAWLECVNEHAIGYELIGAVMLGRSVALHISHK